MYNKKVLSAALTDGNGDFDFCHGFAHMANASEPVVYFADASETPGSVYKVENGTELTYWTLALPFTQN